jgi:hypothetical protein
MTTQRIKVGGNDAKVKELRALVDRDPLNVNQRFMLALGRNNGTRTAADERRS